jgi:hypothetical protein
VTGTLLVGCAVRTVNVSRCAQCTLRAPTLQPGPPLPVREGGRGDGRGAGGEGSGGGPPFRRGPYHPIFDRGFASPTEPSLTMAESVITTNGRGSIVTVPLPSWRTT